MVKEEHCLSRDSNGCDDRNDVPLYVTLLSVMEMIAGIPNNLWAR